MADKARIELAVVLSNVPDVRDRCIGRLSQVLRDRSGIILVHLRNSADPSKSEVCIHYEPERISLPEVRALAQRVGAEIDERYGHLIRSLLPMSAGHARTTEVRIMRLPGILEAVVSPAGMLRVEFDRQVTDESSIESGLKSLRVVAEERRISAAPDETSKVASAAESPHQTHDDDHDHKHDHAHGGWLGEKAELGFSVACGVLLLMGWGLEASRIAGSAIPKAFYVAAFFLGGFFTVREAIEKLRSGRFEIDLLMLVAAIGAAALGEWFEGALLLFLFSLGHALEHSAMGRAKRAIESLADIAPKTARVRRQETIQEVPLEQLRTGDIVVVKPNERLPADGFVVAGSSSVNQAPITGESVPVDKQAVGDVPAAASNPDRLEAQFRVFAGTINGSGALEIRVTRAAADSTLARVVRMVSEAETQKSPTQRFTDRFERAFAPTSLGVAFLLLFSWVAIDEPFSASFYRAMSFLVAASPCALAIATPSAVLSAIARAARGGVLVKGGGPLENLGRVDAIAFDKTGTLTEGKPRLVDVIPAEGVDEKELLEVAVAVEVLSDHPLATAVVRGGRDRLGSETSLKAENVEAIVGRGVRATIGGEVIAIGKKTLFDAGDGSTLSEGVRDAADELGRRGRTTMIVRRGQRDLGVLGVMDTPRPAARGVIDQLRTLGIRRMIMLSGDNQTVAEAIAREVGLTEAQGDLMPDDKVARIRDLSRSQGVAMVGDGVNDAPALAAATVGIAMGAAGSDVALETADVALMADDLRYLPFAVGLSRQTSRVIRQNLWFSLGVVAFLVPATLLGLRMGAAVLFHEGSTLLVVFNALRLMAYRDDSREDIAARSAA
jgi:Cd2+/Zn2+-exporting ATPase